MKKRLTALLLIVTIPFAFCSCKENDADVHSQTAAGYGDEENTVFIDPYEEKTAQKEISGADVSCEVWAENGETLGFIMRFSQKTLIDSELASPENVYFAQITESENKKGVIPIEDIQISTDIKTNEYVIKMLYTTDKKGTVGIDFCLSERENAENTMIFCAKSECTLP